MSTRRALAALLALLALSSFWPLACADGSVDPDGGPGAVGGQPAAVAGQAGAGGGTIASTAGGASVQGGKAGAGGGAGVTLPLGGGGKVGGAGQGGGSAAGAGGVVVGGPKVPESAWVDVPLPIKGELKVLPDVASLEPIFVWEPCESGIPGCEHARVVWQELEGGFMFANAANMGRSQGRWVISLPFRGSCSSPAELPIPMYPVVVDSSGVPLMVARTSWTKDTVLDSVSSGNGQYAMVLIRIDEKDATVGEFALVSGALGRPNAPTVSKKGFSFQDYYWAHALGVFLPNRLVTSNGVFIWSFPLDGGDHVIDLFGDEWKGVAWRPRPMGDDWAIWGEHHAPGRIFISDGVTPARLLVANDDGHRSSNVVVAGNQLAWLKGIGEIQEVLGEYERFELWAADFDPDPAKIVPHKVRDMPLGKLPGDGETNGGVGYFAIGELSVLQLTSLVDGTQRQLDYGEWGIADLMGLTDEHVYMAMRPDSGKNSCNDLFRQRIVDVPVVP